MGSRPERRSIGVRIIPRGDKSKYTDKQKRKAEHIEESYEARGVPEEEARRRAWATVHVVGLSDALRQELKEDKIEGIRVCTVMPMAHATDFFEHAGSYTGHETEPIPPTYDPKVTIDALVGLVAGPRDEVITGRQGPVFEFLHRLMPDAIERLMAKNTETAQLDKAPPAPATSGTVHRPSGGCGSCPTVRWDGAGPGPNSRRVRPGLAPIRRQVPWTAPVRAGSVTPRRRFQS